MIKSKIYILLRVCQSSSSNICIFRKICSIFIIFLYPFVFFHLYDKPSIPYNPYWLNLFILINLPISFGVIQRLQETYLISYCWHLLVFTILLYLQQLHLISLSFSFKQINF